MTGYFLSMNHLVHLEENLPNLAPVDDPEVARMIRSARGVVMPRGATDKTLSEDCCPGAKPVS